MFPNDYFAWECKGSILFRLSKFEAEKFSFSTSSSAFPNEPFLERGAKVR
jgi:hypothetical protein